MALISGRPFLERQILFWYEQGITDFFLSLGYLSGSVISHFKNLKLPPNINFITEDKPLGTGGALLHCLSFMQTCEELLVMNGDTFFEIDLIDFEKFHFESHADWSIALTRSEDLKRYSSVKLSSEGCIESLECMEINSDNSLVNGGVYIVNPNILRDEMLNFDPPFSIESSLIPELLKLRYRFKGREYSGRFIDIGLPDDYNRAQKYILKDD